MKAKLIPSLAIAIAIASSCPQPACAAEPTPVAVSHGIGFLPLDFYPKHREELGISNDQVREMQKLVGRMREPGEKLESMMRERAKALQEAVGQNPVDVEKAMERFEDVMQAENEMKSLQSRTRMELRTVLHPEQYEKVRAMAVKAQPSHESAAFGGLHDKLRQVREEIGKRSGGKVPHELMEKLEQIEQFARQGHAAEAKEQLDGFLHKLAGAKESGHPEKGGIQQQLAKMEEAMKSTSDPEQRERIEQQMRKLRETHEAGKGHEGAKRQGGEEIEKQMHRIAEAAEHSDRPRDA